MSELTAERLSELRRIAQAATPGTWYAAPCPDNPRWWTVAIPRPKKRTPNSKLYVYFDREADARHVSTFDPRTVLALLDEIERRG